ncbi:hypothetical protein HanXRQr2_Chr14g0637091 [Helianthus annuus]|uniref:Uncharacterized protein n=1 Tax=Helianthus annuus TaxID=4232 RepID=A0A9K3H5Q0_HELAN|nr:hypothetical protein HanXRQr2_Chr14g0637091 [Helianthus annuus]
MEMMVALLMKLLMQFRNFLLQPSNICFRNSNLLQLRSCLHFKGTCWSPNLGRKPSFGLLLTK